MKIIVKELITMVGYSNNLNKLIGKSPLVLEIDLWGYGSWEIVNNRSEYLKLLKSEVSKDSVLKYLNMELNHSNTKPEVFEGSDGFTVIVH